MAMRCGGGFSSFGNDDILIMINSIVAKWLFTLKRSDSTKRVDHLRTLPTAKKPAVITGGRFKPKFELELSQAVPIQRL